MMSGLFTVTRKLLMLWGASTFVAIAIVGGIFAYSMNTYYGEVADQKIKDGLYEVRRHLFDQEAHLEALLQDFSKRTDVQSSLGLISKYQDIKIYQPLIFDAEKSKMATQLDELVGITKHHYFAMYDAQANPIAYHFEQPDMANGFTRSGIVSYKNGVPLYLEGNHGEGVVSSVRHLPKVLMAVAPDANPTYGRALLSASDIGLHMTLYAPIERRRKSGVVEFIGTIVAIYIFDKSAFNDISRRIGSDLEYAYLGNGRGAAPFGWTTDAPDLFRDDGNYHPLESADGFSGQVTLTLDDGKKAGISIHTDKTQLLTGLSAFENSVVWGLLIFISVMTPIGIYFIHHIVSKPIQSLIAGVSAVAEGRDMGMIKISSRDEFGTLAKAFGDMAATIRAREQDLIEYQAGLEKTVLERTEKLKATEAKTRQIVNSAVDGIITTDEKGVIVSFNTAAEKIFGYSVIEIVGKNVSVLMPRHQAAHHDEYLSRYVNGADGKIIGMGRELVAKKKDGSIFLADFSISDFHHGDSITFVGIIRDITERKESEYKLQSALQELQNTQGELVQAEKMASLGGLVAGVAHEINTPIGVGLTAATHLKEQAQSLAETFASGKLKKSDFQAFIETANQSTNLIYTNLNRASDLIKSFKQVAVDQTSDETRQINLIEYIEEILESLRPNLKRATHKIEVTGDRHIVIDTHPGALSQVVTNLVMNSVIHAYDEGDDGHIRINAEKEGEAVALTYSDDGKGMNDDVQSKMFDPFFTTKRGSGGSGLGMHILYNQVTQTLGGSIDFHSAPGCGTAFEITIPLDLTHLQAGEA